MFIDLKKKIRVCGTAQEVPCFFPSRFDYCCVHRTVECIRVPGTRYSVS